MDAYTECSTLQIWISKFSKIFNLFIHSTISKLDQDLKKTSWYGRAHVTFNQSEANYPLLRCPFSGEGGCNYRIEIFFINLMIFSDIWISSRKRRRCLSRWFCSCRRKCRSWLSTTSKTSATSSISSPPKSRTKKTNSFVNTFVDKLIYSDSCLILTVDIQSFAILWFIANPKILDINYVT